VGARASRRPALSPHAWAALTRCGGPSFYELDAEGRIVYARDLVEPALKPGSSALLARPAQPGSLT
jgi:hypothetical protein